MLQTLWLTIRLHQPASHTAHAICSIKSVTQLSHDWSSLTQRFSMCPSTTGQVIRKTLRAWIH